MPIMRIARYPNRNALLRHTFGVPSVNGHVTSVDISCCCCCCWWWWWWVVVVVAVVVVVSYKCYWLKSHLISSTNIPTLRTARCLFTQSQWLKQTKNIGHVWKKNKNIVGGGTEQMRLGKLITLGHAPETGKKQFCGWFASSLIFQFSDWWPPPNSSFLA